MERGVEMLVRYILWGARQEVISGQHIVNEQRGPTNGKQYHDCHQHLHHLLVHLDLLELFPDI